MRYFRTIHERIEELETDIVADCKKNNLKTHLEINREVKNKLDAIDGNLLGAIFGLKDVNSFNPESS